MFTRRLARAKAHTGKRTAAAAVEVIPCLGILLLLTFGTIEVCGGFQVKQALSVAAFEGVRAGIRRSRDEEDIFERTRDVLEFYDVDWSAPGFDSGGSYDAIPNNSGEYGIFIETPDDRPLMSLDALEPVKVEIVVDASKNTSPIVRHLVERRISASVIMVREFDPPETAPGG